MDRRRPARTGYFQYPRKFDKSMSKTSSKIRQKIIKLVKICHFFYKNASKIVKQEKLYKKFHIIIIWTKNIYNIQLLISSSECRSSIRLKGSLLSRAFLIFLISKLFKIFILARLSTQFFKNINRRALFLSFLPPALIVAKED